MENLEIALLLMVVGMATVFVILLIVIYLSKGLISLVNKVAPEEIIEKKRPAVSAQVAAKSGVNSQEAAIIISAVSMATNGLGKVINIEKI